MLTVPYDSYFYNAVITFIHAHLLDTNVQLTMLAYLEEAHGEGEA